MTGRIMAAVLGTAGLMISVAQAQDGSIAVINVDRIYKQYAPLQQRLQPLKRDAAELDKSAQLRQVELETTQRKLAAAPKGSLDFEKLQLQVSKLQTEYRLFVERERRGLQKREADVLAGVFREMEDEVKKICKARGIKLVLRQNEASLTDEKPEEILKAINRAIIYEDGADITEEVLAAMNAKKDEKEFK